MHSVFERISAIKKAEFHAEAQGQVFSAHCFDVEANYLTYAACRGSGIIENTASFTCAFFTIEIKYR